MNSSLQLRQVLLRSCGSPGVSEGRVACGRAAPERCVRQRVLRVSWLKCTEMRTTEKNFCFFFMNQVLEKAFFS